MNTAVRAAVRIGLDRGHVMLGVRHGFPGLAEGEVEELDWMSVNGWATRGGCELGTDRIQPANKDLYALARSIEKFDIQGLLIIGGWTGYLAGYQLFEARENYPAFNIPIVLLPASINNNLPGSDLSVGADTALNNFAEAVDKIKDPAPALRRVFVVEVLGRYCAYLALMSGLATGAERVYMDEEGVTLRAADSTMKLVQSQAQSAAAAMDFAMDAGRGDVAVLKDYANKALLAVAIVAGAFVLVRWGKA